MKLEINNTYHGFKLIEEKPINEINSIARIFYHEKSGARLLQLQNEDDNKAFSINFRTLPSSNNGLPHIMEHSVLCGSRKYPVRDPFAELIKGSLNTFLNAATYPDKTQYYFASTNDKDFLNLMDVYMDAVLYPNIYNKPETLMQEGWHYELFSPEDEITYKGIVYNEMKGAFSTPEEYSYSKALESLFPDSVYKYESGGYPDDIPNLTYEEFLDFHRKYYHPSNSYIYTYGNGDILKQLQLLNDGFLTDFDYTAIDSHIDIQTPFGNLKEMVAEYPVGSDEDEEDKTLFSLNFAIGKSSDPVLSLSLEILENILLETPASPLKTALIESGLGSDVFGHYIDYILQPVLRIILKDSNENSKDKFLKIVFDTLEQLCNDGIDKSLIEAGINSKEFALREADYGTTPKGIMYCEKVLNSWLYDAHPTLHLEYDKSLQVIKEATNTDYFENFIKKYLLDNRHCSLVILKPSKDLSDKKAQEIRNKLSSYKASLSQQEVEKLIDDNLRLKTAQDMPDSPEALEKLPLLSKNDINPKAEVLPLVEKEESGVKVLFHPTFTNKIAYINFLFNTSRIEPELIPYVTLLCSILGESSTENYHYSDLSNEININTGGITYENEAYDDIHDKDKLHRNLIIKSRALIHKVPVLVKLLAEIINTTNLTDKKRIKELISQTKSRMEMILLDNGHIVSAIRLSSYFNSAGRYRELANGISFYRFIADLDENFDEKSEEISKNLISVSSTIFNKNNLIISLTTSEDDYSKVSSDLCLLIDGITSENVNSDSSKIQFNPENEGLLTPSEVQYVAKGYNFIKLGYSYSGALRVLTTIVSMNYLWEKVRIQGGAYGGFARIDRGGDVFFLSYRDPNLSETLEVYNNIPDYVRTFDASDREITKFIIGTISQLDTPLTPSLKGEISTINYLRGLSQDKIQRERDEILRTTVKDINNLYELISSVIEKNYYCVLGNEALIRENSEVFNTLVQVFE